MVGTEQRKKQIVENLKRDKKGRFTGKLPWHWLVYLFLFAGVLAMTAYGLEKYHEFRNTYGLQKPFVFSWDFEQRDVVYRLPPREELRPVIVTVEKETEFTPIEQKIIDTWGYKDGIVALAIFDCGESRLNPEAVSKTGDLGIAQINWPIWKDKVFEKFGYTAKDMFNPDRNLEVAYWIWDRADGTEGNGQGTWEPWSGFNNGAYTNCFK
jgi:hypothetical protein